MASQEEGTDRLSAIFSALADPTRREILARLSSGDATVTELAEPFQISLPAISRHLKVLENAGLITRNRNAQWRTSSLQVEPLREAMGWIEHYRRFWDSSLDRLDEHLRRMQATVQVETKQSKKTNKTKTKKAASPSRQTQRTSS